MKFAQNQCVSIHMSFDSNHLGVSYRLISQTFQITILFKHQTTILFLGQHNVHGKVIHIFTLVGTTMRDRGM